MIKKSLVGFILFSVMIFANDYEDALKYFKQKEYEKSLKSLNEAYNNNDKRALYSLGYMYYFGYGTDQNYTKSMDLFLQASKEGSSKSYKYLGLMYGNGQGVSVDDQKAVYYYQIGVDKQEPDCMCDLAEYYINGWGVHKNYFEAIELVKKGHELGGQYCKKVWDKYQLASKKEKNQLDYQTERKACEINVLTSPDIAMEHCEYAIQLVPSDHDTRVFLATAYYRMGKYIDVLKELDFLEDQLLDNTTKLAVFTQKANTLNAQQKYTLAEEYFKKSVKLLETIKDKKTVKIFKANINNGLGLIYMANEQYNKAMQFFQKALINTEFKAMKRLIINNMALVQINQENYKDAVESLNSAMELSYEIDDHIELALIASNLAYSYLMDGQLKKAKKISMDAIRGAENSKVKSTLFNAYFVYSAVMEKEGNKKEADIYFDEAVTLASEMGITFEEEKKESDYSALKILKSLFKKK